MKRLLTIIIILKSFSVGSAQNFKLGTFEYPVNISAADYLSKEFNTHEDSLIPIGKNKVFKYINTKTNKQVIDNDFEEAYPFSQGYGLVKSNGKYGIINRAGGYVINPKYHFFSFLYSPRPDNVIAWDDETFFDFQTGELTKNPSFGWDDPVVHQYISSYQDINGKYGLNYDDGRKSRPIYDSVLASGEFVAIVKKDKKIGVINNKGIVIVPFMFTDKVLESNRIYALRKRNEWHYFKYGKELFKSLHKPIHLKESLFLVETKDGFNYLDNTGEFLLKEYYKWLSDSGHLGINSKNYLVIFDKEWREQIYYIP